MQISYLQAMGIPVWRQRRFLPGARLALHYSLHFFCGPKSEVSGAVLVEEPTADTEKALAFIAAVAQGIGLKHQLASRRLHFSCRELYASGHLPSSLRFLLVMGTQLGQMLYQTPADFVGLYAQDQGQVQAESGNRLETLITHHPAAFLLQPALKRQLWKDLQQMDFMRTPEPKSNVLN